MMKLAGTILNFRHVVARKVKNVYFIKHFIFQLMRTNCKILRLLKWLKL